MVTTEISTCLEPRMSRQGLQGLGAKQVDTGPQGLGCRVLSLAFKAQGLGVHRICG